MPAAPSCEHRRKENDMTIMIASSNRHKITEIAARCADISEARFVPVSEIHKIGEIIEDGLTFEANALIKARAVRDKTGMPALADDSGLVIDALGGEPGIFSARYGGLPDDVSRNRFILEKMRPFDILRRNARFVCVIALALPDGREWTVRGECDGVIGDSPRGNDGFGYDPIFVLPDGRTMAELPLVEKNRVSHRAVALDKFHSLLIQITAANE
jgi:non-canonical purine NTP pyrophosphatase (RdgB/HAM1 family)